jgi:hypothetical protein
MMKRRYGELSQPVRNDWYSSVSCFVGRSEKAQDSARQSLASYSEDREVWSRESFLIIPRGVPSHCDADAMISMILGKIIAACIMPPSRPSFKCPILFDKQPWPCHFFRRVFADRLCQAKQVCFISAFGYWLHSPIPTDFCESRKCRQNSVDTRLSWS